MTNSAHRLVKDTVAHDIQPMRIWFSLAVLVLATFGPAGSASALDIYTPNFSTPNVFAAPNISVGPEVRIAPEQNSWNAYDNPLTAPHRTPPWLRDNDGDGIPNRFDYDDNHNQLQPPNPILQLLPPKD